MANDDDDKPSHLRVVSENPSARVDREIVWAREEAQRSLAEFAATLLRTMAGSDSESIYLIRKLSDFVDALNKFRQDSGHGLTVAEIQKTLRIPRTEFDTSDDDWRHRQWLREHGMEIIVKGALRLAAHKILGEEPHFGGKYSERVIEQGIETLEELHRPAPPRPQSKAKQVADDWIDSGPSPSGSPQQRKHGSTKRTGFTNEDLKELRKAIDSKRIAELTSKIGNPSFKDE